MPENEFTYSWKEMPKHQLPVVNLVALALRQLNDVVTTAPCLCNILKIMWAAELRLPGSMKTQESRGCIYPGPLESTLVCTHMELQLFTDVFSGPLQCPPALCNICVVVQDAQHLCTPTAGKPGEKVVLCWPGSSWPCSIKLSPPKRHHCHEEPGLWAVFPTRWHRQPGLQLLSAAGSTPGLR